MKHCIIGMAMALLPAQALACPVSASLVERYGISFSGFDVPIPAGQEPDTARGGPFVRMALAEAMFVSDGFRHALVLDTASRKAWILRTGGFAGVYEWFGPVDAGSGSLEGCRLETVSADGQAPARPQPARPVQLNRSS